MSSSFKRCETRSGLLIALYREINERRLAAVAAVLAATSSTLPDVARVVSDAYMACHAALGPEWHAIGAAMRGDVVRRRCIAIIGAAEALSDAMVRERLSERIAADELCSLILAWLGPVDRAAPAQAPRSQPRRQNGRLR
jgi:hypothetical protein